MGRSQNRFDLHTVTPYLIVEDLPKLIKFLEVVFAGRCRRPLVVQMQTSVDEFVAGPNGERDWVFKSGSVSQVYIPAE
jgi:hypothetical protein